MKAERIEVIYPSGFKAYIPKYYAMENSPAELVAEKVLMYLTDKDQCTMKEVERYAMDAYEELKAMNKLDIEVSFRWKITAKMHIHPFTERYAFSILRGKQLLVSIHEPTSFTGVRTDLPWHV